MKHLRRRRLFYIELFSIFLVAGLLGGCAPTGLEITGKLGADLSAVRFPHHSLDRQEVSPDFSRWTYRMVLSDDSDACGSIQAQNADNIFGLDSVTAVMVSVIWVGLPFAEGRISANASRYDVIFEEDFVVGERAMLLDVIVKEEGDYTFRASSSFNLSEFLPMELNILEMEDEQLPALGTFSGILLGDEASPERNDVDANDDGVPDYRGLDVEISGAFEEPVVCGE